MKSQVDDVTEEFPAPHGHHDTLAYRAVRLQVNWNTVVEGVLEGNFYGYLGNAGG